MAIPTVINIDTTRIPVEGSSTFREDASYVWGALPNTITSLNSAIAEINNVSIAIDTKALQVSNDATTASNSATTAQNAANDAIAAKDAAESAVATLPEGTLSDSVIATDKVWSSSKVNDELNTKQPAGTYNTVIGTDTDINTSGSTIVDYITVTDGVITAMGTRTLTLADLGYTGATNANYYVLPADVVHTTGATFTGLVAYDDTATTGAIDCSLGNSFSHSVTANTTYSFTNVPASGNACIVTLKLYDAGSYTLTFPTSVKWSGGTAPTFTAIGDDTVVFYTIDGGTTWYANANVGYA